MEEDDHLMGARKQRAGEGKGKAVIQFKGILLATYIFQLVPTISTFQPMNTSFNHQFINELVHCIDQSTWDPFTSPESAYEHCTGGQTFSTVFSWGISCPVYNNF